MPESDVGRALSVADRLDTLAGVFTLGKKPSGKRDPFGLRRAALGIIRIYTKPVGKDADFKDPVILPVGGTVLEAAEGLHKDFAKKLKFAKVWGSGLFEGQQVGAAHPVEDGDILELHD